MQGVLWKDAQQLAADEMLPWEAFDGKAIVVTGATGLIGKTLVATLLSRANLSDQPLPEIKTSHLVQIALFKTYSRRCQYRIFWHWLRLAENTGKD